MSIAGGCLEKRRFALRATAVYAVLGALWMPLSDGICSTLAGSADQYMRILLIKNSAFIVLTSVALYRLLCGGKPGGARSGGTPEPSRGMYRDLVRNARTIILKRDREGGIIYCNDFSRDFFGLGEQRMQKDSPGSCVLPEVSPSAGFRVPGGARIFGKGRTECVRGDGERVRILWDYSASVGESGAVGEVEYFGRDVSEYARVEDALRKSEAHHRSLFENMLNGHAYCKMLFEGGEPVDYIYIGVNSAFETLTGLKNVTGRRASEVIPGFREGDRELLNAHAKVVLTGEPSRFEVFANGLGLWLSCSVYRPQEGHFVSLFDVVTERKKAEEALRTSLREKVALLQEVHHRVKNNLQIVASLLNLQASRAVNRHAMEILRNTRDRVRSMALLHELLYRSKNLAAIYFPSYVDDLCAQLLRASGHAGRRISLRRRIAPIMLPLEHCVPCGLIINELVSNAMKHGFPEERCGTIVVELRQSEEPDCLTLSVTDDGVGPPSGMDLTAGATLGLQLVSNLAGQLGGRLVLDKPGAGAAVTLIFPIPEGSEIEADK